MAKSMQCFLTQWPRWCPAPSPTGTMPSPKTHDTARPLCHSWLHYSGSAHLSWLQAALSPRFCLRMARSLQLYTRIFNTSVYMNHKLTSMLFWFQLFIFESVMSSAPKRGLSAACCQVLQVLITVLQVTSSASTGSNPRPRAQPLAAMAAL